MLEGKMAESKSSNNDTQIQKQSKPLKKIPDRFQASVVVLKGHPEGMEFLISKEYTVLGRDKDADIFLKDAQVSRQHAAIEYREGNYTLRDLESTNGTRMSGSLIKETNLHHGDKFSMGDTTLQFVLEDTGKSRTYEIG
jgi:pSer/pThr/pTyr-binding forkhead associated (FHA) protein